MKVEQCKLINRKPIYKYNKLIEKLIKSFICFLNNIKKVQSKV